MQKKYQDKDMLRFITCGSVDDGKSTLMGRLLYENQMIYKDQLDMIEKDSKKFGTTGDNLDLALLVDGLQSEREQGITIDVAYRYFSTKKRKFIMADTPGHEQYTRNMATGASTADLAMILIDARKGVLTQTKRHSYIASLFGIKHIIVAINKMDLVGFSQTRYEEIQREYKSIISNLKNAQEINFSYIPLSALNGDNVLNESKNTPWYRGKTLMELLEDCEILHAKEMKDDFRFPVQYINRPNQNFRGYCGTIANGSIGVGEKVMILPSKKTSTIKSIILPTINELTQVNVAYSQMAVTLTLEDEIDISRGDMIVHANDTLVVGNKFEVMMIWMDESPMKMHEKYVIKIATKTLNGNFTSIKYKKNIDTFEKQTVDKLELNDIAKCTIELEVDILIDRYNQSRYTGSFIVIDRYTNDTAGAGIIVSDLKKEHKTNQESKKYSQAEIGLNEFIRKNYPQWSCKKIK